MIADSRTGTGRARPMPPDERRAMLIATTSRLLAEHGTKVTTKQIAEAAGIAEGTIFRVFPDKEALMQAALQQCFDPLPTLAALQGVDADLPLEQRIVEITRVLQERLIGVFNVLMAMGMTGPPHHAAAEKDRRRMAMRNPNERIVEAITELLEPDRDRFRVPVTDVVRMLRLVTFSSSHPLISEGNLLTPEQITHLVLDGIRRRPTTDPTHGGDPC